MSQNKSFSLFECLDFPTVKSEGEAVIRLWKGGARKGDRYRLRGLVPQPRTCPVPSQLGKFDA